MPLYRDLTNSFPKIDYPARELALARAIYFNQREYLEDYKGRVPNHILFPAMRIAGRLHHFVEPPLSAVSCGETANMLMLKRWRNGKVRGRIITQKDVEECKSIIDLHARIEEERRKRESAILRKLTEAQLAALEQRERAQAAIASATGDAQPEPTADDVAEALVKANGADWWAEL